MNVEDYLKYDGLGLAELVRRREVTARELVDTAIDLAERLNPKLNAIVHKAYELAREAADAHNVENQPFAGVPILLKDLLADCIGMPTRRGSALVSPEASTMDSEHVRRFRSAGLIPIGKTNTPEFGLVAACEPKLYGPARNPWNLKYSTGGSSGGSAAAVAAGIVPIAHGNDYGGSIRVPASCCGVVGLKPTRARVPVGPQWGDVMSGIQQDHVITRSVRDTAAALDATSGPMPGDPYVAPSPQGRFLESITSQPSRLRIAVAGSRYDGSPFHPDVARVLAEVSKLCDELGHKIVTDSPAIDFETLPLQLFRVWAAGVGADIETVCKAQGHPYDANRVEPLTAAIYDVARQTSSSEYLSCVAALQRGARVMAAFFNACDVWLYPTLNDPPLLLGEIDTAAGGIQGVYGKLLPYNCYAWYFNMSGGPAISLPLGQSAIGLPIGMTFGAGYGDDERLLSLAAQLEEACPWSSRIPRRNVS